MTRDEIAARIAVAMVRKGGWVNSKNVGATAYAIADELLVRSKPQTPPAAPAVDVAGLRDVAAEMREYANGFALAGEGAVMKHLRRLADRLDAALDGKQD